MIKIYVRKETTIVSNKRGYVNLANKTIFQININIVNKKMKNAKNMITIQVIAQNVKNTNNWININYVLIILYGIVNYKLLI